MKPLRIPGLCAALLCFLPFCAAEDWTTTDGKTYHDVKDLGHNNQEVNISCRENVSWLLLKDLPVELQTRYRYDAEKEKAMDAYLVRVVAMPGLPPDPADIQNYTKQVQALIANPSPLKNLSPEQIVWLLSNRLIVGGYLSYKLAPADAQALRVLEIKLIGIMLLEIESRIDPTVDPKKRYSIQDDTAESRKARDQWAVRRQRWEFVSGGKHYIRVLFDHVNDEVSIDGEVRPILSQAGIDPLSTNYLLGISKVDSD